MNSPAAVHPNDMTNIPDRVCSVMVLDGAGLSKRNGGGVRSRVILDTLKELGDVHVISIAAKARHKDRFQTIEGVASQQVIVSSLSRWDKARPLFAAWRSQAINNAQSNTKSNAVRAAIEAIVGESSSTSLVVLRYFRAWELAQIAASAQRNRLCVWLDLDDRDDRVLFGKLKHSKLWIARRLAVAISRAKKRTIEAAALQSELCTLASESDLVDFAKGANTVALANVVPAADYAKVKTPSTSVNLLFVGSYSWAPNRDAIDWFLTHCWSDIHAAFPNATLRVVGTGKRSEKDALERKFSGLPSIQWHHDAPDLIGFYADCRLVISPVLSGSGSKIKVIEGASYARPIVVTTHSARGLSPQMLDNISIATTPSEYVSHCLNYLSDPAKADRDGEALLKAQQQSHSMASFQRTAFTSLRAASPSLAIPSAILAKLVDTPPPVTEVRR